jgi:hypothetical protein
MRKGSGSGHFETAAQEMPMRFAAAVAVPPSCRIASAFFRESEVCMAEFNHSLNVDSTVVYSEPLPPLTLAAMLEQEPVHTRLKSASEAAGYGGDTAIARAKLGAALHISPAAVAKLFNGETTALKAINCFAAADLFGVDARWLATGQGEMRPQALPTDVQDVARMLHKIQSPEVRRVAVQLARIIAADPLGQISLSMGAFADGQRWSPTVTRVADGLEGIADAELKKLAIAWATTAAFNPERLPQAEETAAKVPARRATDKRSTP